MKRMRSVSLGFAVVLFASTFCGARTRDAYIFMRGDRLTVTLSSTDNISLSGAETARKKYGSNFLWFLRSGSEYVIHDRATLDTIEALFAPQRALEPEQEAISKEESEVDRLIDEITDRDDDEPLDASAKTRLQELEQRAREIQTREHELDRKSDELERRAEKELWSLADKAIRTGIAVKQ